MTTTATATEIYNYVISQKGKLGLSAHLTTFDFTIRHVLRSKDGNEVIEMPFLLSEELYLTIKNNREFQGSGNVIVYHNINDFIDVVNASVRIEAIDELLAELA